MLISRQFGWGHAKDYVNGMWKILQYSHPDDWVLATGTAITVRDFAEKVFKKIGIKVVWSGSGLNEIGVDENGKTIVRIDQKYFRPTEVPHLLGDSAKAKKLLNWEPKYTLDDLIEEMVENELSD